MSYLRDSLGSSPFRRWAATVVAGWLAFSAIAEGASIYGRVVGPSGEPLPGIQLRWAVGAPDAPPAVTNDQGGFVLQAAPSRERIILLNGDSGEAGVRLPDHAAEAGELQLTYPVRTEIVLLHDNDLHWHYNHAEQLREVIRFLRESRPNVFLLNAGDTFVRHRHRWAEDSLAYYERMSAFIIDQMNETGYDVKALGNHEVDYKEDITLRQLQRAKFPVIGANVRSSTRLYFTPPSHVYFSTDSGLRIAVLGMTVGSAPEVEVANRPATVREHLHLRQESDLFVLLTHIGLRADRQLAEQFHEIDVIIGGHSHTLLREAEMVNGVLVAQAGGHRHVDGGAIDTTRPMFLGVVQVLFENRELLSKRGRVFEVDADNYLDVPEQIQDWLIQETAPFTPLAD